MNAFRNPFLLIVLFCSLFLVKCNCPEDSKSIVPDISKAWKISELTVTDADGTNPVTSGTEGFTLTLNNKDEEPTTYTITTGGLAYNFAPSNSGSWSLNNNENPTQITFGSNTVDLLNASETQLVIQYKEEADPGKQEPTVKFTLVPR